jgi:hypothetical protein
MIATRLHAKRHSGSALNRPSVTSLNIPHHHILYQQRRKTSTRPSDAIQNIDSDNNNEESDNEIHEGTKVEKKTISYFFFCFSTIKY